MLNKKIFANVVLHLAKIFLLIIFGVVLDSEFVLGLQKSRSFWS